MLVTLNKDIFSNFKQKKVKNGIRKHIKYANKGDKVKIVSTHGNVVIVDKNGSKFPINTNDYEKPNTND